MPIEIRELHVRMEVTTPAASGQAGASGSREMAADTGRSRANDEVLVTACVERVMEMLRSRGER